jgi:Flp pilus assembly CpaF family ATPase
MLDKSAASALEKELKEILIDHNKIAELYGMNSKDAKAEIMDFNNQLKLAEVNDLAARTYIIDLYVKLLRYLGYGSKEKMASLIDFDDYPRNEDYVLLELLLMNNDLSHYLNKYKIGVEPEQEEDSSALTDEELKCPDIPEEYPEKFSSKKLRAIIVAEKENLDALFGNTMKRVELLATMFYASSYGSDIIDSLTLQMVSEVAFREKSYIYIIYKGVKIWLSFLKFSHTHKLEAIQRKATGLSSIKYEEKEPTVIASKANGSRITVAGFSSVPDATSRYYNERIFTLSKMTLEQMLDVYNTINQDVFNFMVLNQRGRGAYVVSGADMGVGKSSMLVALLAKTPLKWGIGVLDPQNEMQLAQKFPELNSKTMTPGPNMTISKCFEIILKQARDVLCVSEIAGPEEMGELVKAATRLNSGVGATIHSISDEEVVPNATELLMSTNRYDTREAAELAVAKSINLVYHMAKLRGGRIVVEAVSEIVPMPRDIYVGDLSLGKDFTLKQKMERKLELEQMYYSKMLYSRPYRINKLFTFDRELGDWRKVGVPTEAYFKRASIHLTNRELAKMHSIFEGAS